MAELPKDAAAPAPPPPPTAPALPTGQVPLEPAQTPLAETKSTDAPGSGSGTATPTDSRWVKAYGSAYSRLPPSLSSRLPNATEAKNAVDSMSARISSSADKGNETFKARRARLRSEFLSHGYSVANATHIPLYISLNQVGPLMYEAVAPNHVFERRAPGLFFLLEVRASGGAYTPWSVAWPILAVSGPAVALASALAIPFVAAATGSAALAGVATAITSTISSASASVTAAGTTIATTAARLALLPGGKKLHGKLVDAAKNQVSHLKSAGSEQVLRYVTTAVAAVTGKHAASGGKSAETEAEAIEAEQQKARQKVAEVDVTGYPLEKVLACSTGKRKVDKALEDAFEKLDFKTRDFQPKTNPVLRVVGGPELEERGVKHFLVFYPLRLEHIVDLQAEPVPAEETPLTPEEARLVQDAKVVDSWEEASIHSVDAPPHEGKEDDPKKRSWLDAWRSKKDKPTPTPSPGPA